MTPFSQILAQLNAASGGDTATPTEDWLQGRTTYGGLTAALCVEAARQAIPDLPALRSAQFAFIGPASGPLRPSTRVLRRGKSSLYLGVDIEGDAGPAARALLAFGADRPSGLAYQALPAPACPPPEDCAPFFMDGRGPRFAAHFDTRLAGGARPMTPGAAPDVLVWSRHLDPLARDSLVGLIALADALPPAAMTCFQAPAPISTSTWSFDMLTTEPRSPEGWWLFRSTAETIGDGYSTQSMTLWRPDGRPVLVGRQNVAVFA